MKTGAGAMQCCYNPQTALSEDGIIVATGLLASPGEPWVALLALSRAS